MQHGHVALAQHGAADPPRVAVAGPVAARPHVVIARERRGCQAGGSRHQNQNELMHGWMPPVAVGVYEATTREQANWLQTDNGETSAEHRRGVDQCAWS